MVITCPNCAAGYDVPDHLLAGTGRRLRCARCAQEFLATLQSGAEAGATNPVAASPPVRPDAPHAERPSAPDAQVAPDTSAVPGPPAATVAPEAPVAPVAPVAQMAPVAAAAPAPASHATPAMPLSVAPHLVAADNAAEAVAPVAGSPPTVRSYFALALTGWVLSLGLLGSLGWAAVHWRNDVMVAWPPSERAYQAVGLN